MISLEDYRKFPVYRAVGDAVWGVMTEAVFRAKDRVVDRDVSRAVSDPVYGAVFEAVSRTVYRDVEE